MAETKPNVYTLAGGMPLFRQLAASFYARVAQDPVLRPLYPESLDEPEENLALFIAQYFGGPPVYSQRRGHPRLRLRHLPFSIGRRERDAWVKQMLAALDESDMPEAVRNEMRSYFQDAATFLMNKEE
jgi:hemoglobin